MSAIIAALIAQLVGVLGPLLLKWIESLFKKVAPSVTSGDPEDLVQAAHDATPRTRIFKRALLRKLKDHAAAIAVGSKLSKADKDEIAGLAAKAKSE